MKTRLLCGFNKACHRLPGICILLQVTLVLGLAGLLGYMFVTRQLFI